MNTGLAARGVNIAPVTRGHEAMKRSDRDAPWRVTLPVAGHLPRLADAPLRSSGQSSQLGS